MFSRRTNLAVTAGCTTAAVALLVYLLLVDATRQTPASATLTPALALSCTFLFLGFGPLVVLAGQRRIVQLASAIHAPAWDRGSKQHLVFVASLTAVATFFAWLPTDSLHRSGVFPMPGPAAVIAYLLISAAASALCSHGTFVAYRYLQVAFTFGRAPGTTLRTLTDEPQEQAFRSAQTVVSWSFSTIGALQLPTLLLFRPALPGPSQAVALLFLLILTFVGTFLFWLPRHWQRDRLHEEAAQLVRRVAAGEAKELLDELPAYEFWMQRLKTTGLSLTLPTVLAATLTRYSDLASLAETVRERL